MQPVSVLLFMIGYPTFALTLARWTDIVAGRARLAALGHQLAGWTVVAGWLLAGRPMFAAIHAGWLLVARFWFGGRRSGEVSR